MKVVASRVYSSTNASGITFEKRATISFTNSGSSDVAIADLSANAVVIKQGPVGNPTRPDVTLTVASGVSDLLVADLNGDGLPDIVACAGGSVQVFLNTFDASVQRNPLTFAAPVTYQVADPENAGGTLNLQSVSAIQIAQTQGAAGVPDVVAVCSTGEPGAAGYHGFLVRFANNGQGVLSSTPDVFSLENGATLVVAADLSGDGYADVIAADANTGEITVIRNVAATNGSRTIDPSVSSPVLYSSDGFIAGLAVGDVDGDGARDLLLLGGNFDFVNNQPLFTSVVTLYHNQNNGFGTLTNYSSLTLKRVSSNTLTGVVGNLAIGNLNGDGSTQEIVVADGLDQRVTILTTDPAQTAAEGQFFASATTVSAGPEARYVDVADLDGDGKPDLFVANTDDTTPGSVFFNGASGGGGGTPGLSIFATESTSSDADKGLITHIGDDLTYTLHWQNKGAVTATGLKVSITIPQYIDAKTNLKKQFMVTDLTFNSFGTYVPATSAKALNAKVVWNVSDLEPGFGQDVDLKIHIGTKVRVAQQFGPGNDYAVMSISPTLTATGYTSKAANLSTDVRTALRLTVTPDTTSVAPGGYVNYTLKLDNLSALAAPNAVAVLRVPDDMRFAGYGLKKGVPLTDPAGAARGAFVPLAPANDEVIVSFGTIAPLKSASATVTLQAKWVNPAEVTGGKLQLLDYGAAFLTSTTEIKFAGALKEPQPISYFNLLNSQSNSTGATFRDSGVIPVLYGGSLANAPRLGAVKGITDDPNNALDDIHYENTDAQEVLNTVEPGKEISFFLSAGNSGNSPAEDVFLQDRLPEGVALVIPGDRPTDPPQPLTHTSSAADLKSAVSFVLPTASIKKSLKFEVTLDADDRTLRITGLHVDAGDSVNLRYTVQVLTAGDAAPAAGALIQAGVATVGTSSDLHTPASYPPATFIKVTGQSTFAFDRLLALPPRPAPSTNAAQTAAQLDALYKKDLNALPVVAQADPKVPKAFIPGAMRFYVKYSNSGVAATDVTLSIPIPANTVFYRTMGVTGGKLGPLPNGATLVSKPAPLQGGTLTYHFNRLNAPAEGIVMVEVIVTPAAATAAGGQVSLEGVQIYDSTSPPAAQSNSAGRVAAKAPYGGAHQQKAKLSSYQVADLAHAPKLGLAINAPEYVKPGDTFNVQCIVFNYGDIACSDATPYFTIPTGTTPVSVTYGNTVTDLSGYAVGQQLYQLVASNDGPIISGDENRLAAHSAGAFTITLKAQSQEGFVGDMNIFLMASYVGKISPASSNLVAGFAQIISPEAAAVFNIDANALYAGRNTSVQNADFIGYPDGGMIIPLGSGQVIVSGGSNLVAQGGGNLIAQGGGNLVAQGGGNLQIDGVQASSFMGSIPAALQGKTINLFNSGAGNLITQDGGGLISNDGGGILASIASLVAQGGGNLVAQGGGNLVAQGGGNLVAQGGGNLVAQGGGNLVAQGGGNIFTYGGAMISSVGSLVAQGGGNVISTGTSLLSTGGSNVISLPDSSAAFTNGAGGFLGGGGSVGLSGP